MVLSKFLESLLFKENVIQLLSYYFSNMIGKTVQSYITWISVITHGRFYCFSTETKNIYANIGTSMYLLLKLKLSPYTRKHGISALSLNTATAAF